MSLKRYFGKGVILEQHKQPALGAPLRTVSMPETAIVPIFDFGLGHMIPIPRVGETVVRNSMLARSKNNAAWVVSPVSGKLKYIERINHPALGSILCAFIKTADNIKPLKLHPHDPNALTGQAVVQIARTACILDELDGLPLYYKLQRAIKQRVLYVVADALDDTPYVSSSLKTVAAHGDLCVDGLGFVLKALDGGKAVLAAYDPGGDSIKDVLGNFGFLETHAVSGGYPAWPRFEAEHCPKKYLRLGVQALMALSNAVRLGAPQTEVTLTVSGDCVSSPCNVIAPIGTPVGHILDEIGLAKPLRHVIIGDTMRGIDCGEQTDFPVYPGIRAITALSTLPRPRAHSCISCGRCTQICPQSLIPSRAVELVQRGERERALSLGADSCDGCGACSAVCPCSIEVADIMLSLGEQPEQE